jgi:NAD+--asparagine ADP-ribosyltransferase
MNFFATIKQHGTKKAQVEFREAKTHLRIDIGLTQLNGENNPKQGARENTNNVPYRGCPKKFTPYSIFNSVNYF